MDLDSPVQSQWQSAAHTVSRPKMDMAKALAILGFSSSRTLDPEGGHDPKVELANALSRQMANLEKKKKMSISKHHAQTIEAKQRDDVRVLHEAYQFLSRRFLSMSSRRGESEDGDGGDHDNHKQRAKQNSNGDEGENKTEGDDNAEEDSDKSKVADDNVPVEGIA